MWHFPLHPRFLCHHMLILQFNQESIFVELLLLYTLQPWTHIYIYIQYKIFIVQTYLSFCCTQHYLISHTFLHNSPSPSPWNLLSVCNISQRGQCTSHLSCKMERDRTPKVIFHSFKINDFSSYFPQKMWQLYQGLNLLAKKYLK